MLSEVKLRGSSTQAMADLPVAAVWRETATAGALGMANNVVVEGVVALAGTAVAAAESPDVTGREEHAGRLGGTGLDHQTAWYLTVDVAGDAEGVAVAAAAEGEESARRRCYGTTPSASPHAYSHSQLPYSLHSSLAGAVFAAAGNERPGAFARDDGSDGPEGRDHPLRTRHRDTASQGSRLGADFRTSDGMRLGGVVAGH